MGNYVQSADVSVTMNYRRGNWAEVFMATAPADDASNPEGDALTRMDREANALVRLLKPHGLDLYKDE